jgi:hypothetical protein
LIYVDGDRKRTCYFNAGMSHSCDYKELLQSADDANHWSSEHTPGKRRKRSSRRGRAPAARSADEQQRPATTLWKERESERDNNPTHLSPLHNQPTNTPKDDSFNPTRTHLTSRILLFFVSYVFDSISPRNHHIHQVSFSGFVDFKFEFLNSSTECCCCPAQFSLSL